MSEKIIHSATTLVINLMTREEKQVEGAVNIPPGKHQMIKTGPARQSYSSSTKENEHG